MILAHQFAVIARARSHHAVDNDVQTTFNLFTAVGHADRAVKTAS
jgi:hypothetical protein